jgi:hypothetical protein
MLGGTGGNLADRPRDRSQLKYLVLIESYTSAVCTEPNIMPNMYLVIARSAPSPAQRQSRSHTHNRVLPSLMLASADRRVMPCSPVLAPTAACFPQGQLQYEQRRWWRRRRGRRGRRRAS